MGLWGLSDHDIWLTLQVHSFNTLPMAQPAGLQGQPKKIIMEDEGDLPEGGDHSISPDTGVNPPPPQGQCFWTRLIFRFCKYFGKSRLECWNLTHAHSALSLIVYGLVLCYTCNSGVCDRVLKTIELKNVKERTSKEASLTQGHWGSYFPFMRWRSLPL
jgi:hypothetical protein